MIKKVLIVDDEATIRELIRATLTGEDYEIHEAENGSLGLDLARSLCPDLVILDLMMPDKWGYVVCEEIKQDPATRHARVMFLTGRGSAPSQKMGALKGADDYMVKPFDPAKLRAKVRKLLETD